MMLLETKKAEYSLTFRAMNTEIELIIYGQDESERTYQKLERAGGQVSLLFAETEDCLSRFKPESELSRLNRQGYLTAASPLLFESVQAALAMADLTSGIFDPTILEALEKAGYDRSFELLTRLPYTLNTALPAWPCAGQYREIELDPASRSIKLPHGLGIDLGGIAKGMTVDRASALLHQAGFSEFMVSAGGDMFLSGHPPLLPEWRVAVQNPLRPDTDLTELAVQNQAIATSAVTKRRWQKNGKSQHHLIDPRTGKPVTNNLAAVTVIAPTTQLADVLAKTALILGPVEGKAFIKQQPNCSALFITMNEEVIK